MTDKPNPDLQRANDMLTAIEQERNSLANRLVHAQADLAAEKRKSAEMAGRVVELEAKLVAKFSNGHADKSVDATA